MPAGSEPRVHKAGLVLRLEQRGRQPHRGQDVPEGADLARIVAPPEVSRRGAGLAVEDDSGTPVVAVEIGVRVLTGRQGSGHQRVLALIVGAVDGGEIDQRLPSGTRLVLCKALK